MIQVFASEIPEGSYEIRIFDGETLPHKSPIKTVLVLENLGDGACEASLAHGSLDNETNIAIARKAHDLGFKTLNFRVLKGTKASRLARYERSDENYDYYTANLLLYFGPI